MSNPTPEQIAEFRRSLDPWINEEGIDVEQKRNRIDCAEVIVGAYSDPESCDTLDLESFDSVMSLDLSGRNLTSLPAALSQLTFLQVLNVSNNRLTSLPHEIFSLTLQDLNVSNNNLTSLPGEISGLATLRTLNASNNRLTTLPHEITRLTALRTLDASNNSLTTIPYEIRLLPELANFDLRSNRFPPEEAIRINTAPHSPALVNARLDLQVLEEDTPVGRATLPLIPRRVATARSVVYIPPAPAAGGAGARSAIFSSTFADSAVVLGQVLNEIFPSTADAASQAYDPEFTEFVLSNSNLGNFRTFLCECTRTKSWEEDRTRGKLIDDLRRIIIAAKSNPQIQEVIDIVAVGTQESCGDRVAMTIVEMQMAALHCPRLPKDMKTPDGKEDYAEMRDYAAKRSAFKFLQDAAAAKFIANGGRGDEIETNLAYMQLLGSVGLDISGTDMLYRRCAGVSNVDLRDTLAVYRGESAIEGMSKKDYLAMKYMLDAPEFAEVPMIKIIKKTAQVGDTSLKEGESEAAYMTRMSEMRTADEAAKIKNLSNILSKAINPGTSPTEADAASASTKKRAWWRW